MWRLGRRLARWAGAGLPPDWVTGEEEDGVDWFVRVNGTFC